MGIRRFKLIDKDPAGPRPHRPARAAAALRAADEDRVQEHPHQRFPLSEGCKKVVLVAGNPSHGYCSHEHNAGCLLLADKLNTAAKDDGLPVIATVYQNGWPKDPTAMDNADCVVSLLRWRRGHYLNDRLEDFDHVAMEHGVGLVCIHYAVETTAGNCGDHFLEWIGGFFEPHWSVNPHWTAKFDEAAGAPDHAGRQAVRGQRRVVLPHAFRAGDEGVTPILSDLPPRETMDRGDGPHSGNPHVRASLLERNEPQHVAWAYERPEEQRPRVRLHRWALPPELAE